ncbi:unnamed protein product [Pleuronectes platessa]|uniref:Uncharacterized protein n=1 Tax=Pleuronectes platessa TaxID=8262 RepID=A0A9N7YML8_PLEPL|nr:unnamed protein product [Pleuronectes platessa]
MSINVCPWPFGNTAPALDRRLGSRRFTQPVSKPARARVNRLSEVPTSNAQDFPSAALLKTTSVLQSAASPPPPIGRSPGSRTEQQQQPRRREGPPASSCPHVARSKVAARPARAGPRLKMAPSSCEGQVKENIWDLKDGGKDEDEVLRGRRVPD